ncbi:DUF4236 domain-containing protein [Anaerobacillus isosaccharinicus]|uniref:DUF4236 domain-containing protein n=1 Tax=Anaerobacillus isosaccharinicus TaxID=1532552 RepID=A0A1S2ME51_9BACI|nr:DUF4236 domain-containing protein [Anaerobacillus isosaccharinicus]MBA5585675.1 DUF4236 domain-containing protein [Anaerobacillus isosaccharinicus]QOY36017.1 DUF4236 domain-containing protein [Anaerobacillus isosaccharinicus]
MSFRFQKRVKVAPGIRLNISKRGVSTSVGRRGGSVTLGRRGLYGNVGLPGSGLSYRTKLDKTTGRTLYTSPQKNSRAVPQTVLLNFDKTSHSLVFVDEDGQRVPPAVERDIKRKFNDDIQKIYDQKEQEINEHTTKLLKLHKETLQERSPEELRDLARKSVTLEVEMPSEREIFEELKVDFEEGLRFFERISLLLPKKRKEFLEKVKNEAQQQYTHEFKLFEQAQEEYEEAKLKRLAKVEKVIAGDPVAMELWLENFLAELDFPLDTNVSFSILSADTIYVDVDLPQMEEIPLTKAEILKSGKLKVQKKSQRELREHYAIMVGGTALYLCSYVFSLLPTCETIIISGYTQVKNKATGHLDDQYIYSLKVDKSTLYSLNMEEVHPIAAFENFEPIINATKTFIFREIKPYEPVEEKRN